MKTDFLVFRIGTLDVPDVPGAGFKFPVATADLGTIINEFLKYLFPLAGLLLFAYLVMAGFSFLTSGGEPKAMEQAKEKITHALAGFLLIFVAYWLVQLLEFIFNLKIF